VGQRGGLAGALGSPGLRTIVTATVGMSGAFGLIDVAMPAFASAHGSSAWAGVLVAVMAFASMLGGLWYGGRRWSGPLDRRYVALFALFGAGLAPLAAADSIPAMAGLMALAGLAIAPVAACIYTLTADVALPGTSTEAFTWLSTSFLGGTAAGAALGGVVIDAAGVRAALLAASGSALLGAAVAALRRGTLRAAVIPAEAGLTAG
jgi:MFS family permease